MRLLFTLIVLAAIGYLGYNYYMDQQAAPGTSATAAVATGRGGSAPDAEPVFQSRIPAAAGAPGEKQLAPPGVFYMLERVSVETPTGVRAVVPGDQVKLLARKKDRLKLTDGSIDFEVPPSKVTNDLDQAREAERMDAMKHPRLRR
jgi:hypothetical protein